MNPNSTSAPAIFIIVGITGDLAKRKLLPAIEALAKAGVLPEKFQVLGTSRRADVDTESLFKDMKDSEYVRKHLEIFTMDVQNSEDYTRLSERLEKCEKDFGTPAQRVFYLSVPPQAAKEVIGMLGTFGLAKVPDTKLLLEKPSGIDLASATDLVEHINEYFSSEQVYRIDHYLAKEMSQDLVVFRDSNTLFLRTWNNDFIERVEILAGEKIGIEGRADFYEQTGALRDLIQSHLLQLAALVCMGSSDASLSLPQRRLAALKSLHVPAGKEAKDYVRRGQYKGYTDEAKNPKSSVETFVSLTLESDSANFSGIPITLTTGKMLKEKTTEIRIFYKQDHGIEAKEEKEANELVIRIQPNEGITLQMNAKVPGYKNELEKKELDFTYAESFTQPLAEGYEKVFFDALHSQHELFVSSEEVLESWRIIAPVQEAWKASEEDLFIYEQGSSSDSI